MTDETKISQRYRELAREEPPRHVDEAILAAARRAADARPAPLVAPSGRRWYFPLAAAAVIVLAVAVTVHVERQQRDVEVAEAPVAAPAAPQKEKAPAAQPSAPPLESPTAGARESARADAAPKPQLRAEAQSVMREKSAAVGALASASPEQWLQGIDDLKRQGKHEEAERELAEFRKRYPNYRIPETITEKFERR